MAPGPVSLGATSTLEELYKDKILKPPAVQSQWTYSKQFNGKIGLWRGDITRLAIDAITNLANKNLSQGGGLCGAVFKAAGPTKLKEAIAEFKRPIEPGFLRVTPGFDLPAGKIIHGVGPDSRVYKENVERQETLDHLYYQIMLQSYMDGIKTVAIPSISTGIFGYPVEEAAPVAVRTIRRFFESDPNQKKLERVIFVVFDDETEKVYERVIP